ncbi:hypothetical protein ACFLSF_01880 [Candidatus Bipolaricaulota bacterium]
MPTPARHIACIAYALVVAGLALLPALADEPEEIAFAALPLETLTDPRDGYWERAITEQERLRIAPILRGPFAWLAYSDGLDNELKSCHVCLPQHVDFVSFRVANMHQGFARRDVGCQIVSPSGHIAASQILRSGFMSTAQMQLRQPDAEPGCWTVEIDADRSVPGLISAKAVGLTVDDTAVAVVSIGDARQAASAPASGIAVVDAAMLSENEIGITIGYFPDSTSPLVANDFGMGIYLDPSRGAVELEGTWEVNGFGQLTSTQVVAQAVELIPEIVCKPFEWFAGVGDTCESFLKKAKIVVERARPVLSTADLRESIPDNAGGISAIAEPLAGSGVIASFLVQTHDLASGDSIWIALIAKQRERSYAESAYLQIRIEDLLQDESFRSRCTELQEAYGAGSQIGKGQLLDVLYSNGGERVAIVTSRGVELRTSDTLELQQTVGTGAQTTCASLSKDGETLAIAHIDSTVTCWAARSGEALCTLALQTGSAVSLALSSDGSTLATASLDPTVLLWDLQSSQLLHSLSVRMSGIPVIAFSPDDALLAFGSWDDTIELWEVSTGQRAATLEAPGRYISSIAFSDDGTLLASGSWTGSVALWDVPQRRLETTIESGWAHSIALAPNSPLLAVGLNSGKVQVWDYSTGTQLQSVIDHWEAVSALVFSPDGSTLATASADGSIAFRDPRTCTVIDSLQGYASRPCSLAFSPDGQTVAIGSTQTIRCYDVTSGKYAFTLSPAGRYANSLSFSADSRLLVASTGDPVQSSWGNEIKVWDLQTRNPVITITDSQEVTAVALSPDGKLLISGTPEGVLKVWDVESGSIQASTKPFESPVGGVAFSNDGSMLAAASGTEGIAVLLDVETLETVHRLLDNPLIPLLGKVAFSADDSKLAVARRGAAKIWDLKSGVLLHSLVDGGQLIRSLGFSRNGEFLVTGSDDGTVRVWDIEEQDVLYSIDAGPTGFDPPTAISGNCSLLAWAEIDGSLSVQALSALGIPVEGIPLSEPGDTEEQDP